MYKTPEERIEQLEKLVEKQAFQLRLLHDLVRDQAQYATYHEILASNMSERSYRRLQNLTRHFEMKLLRDEPVTLGQFLSEFKRILNEDDTMPYVSDITNLVPRWLGGAGNSFGFSPALYEAFYLT